MPLCTCGHEDHEHNGDRPGVDCTRCGCMNYTERPNYARSSSFADLPVSQGARDLWERIFPDPHPVLDGEYFAGAGMALDILAAASEKDVRNLLWARRMGKLP